jgi:spermidine/putrescine transport system substrate-binding protein
MFDTNEDMYAKIKNSKTNYDILFPSDYMIERLIQEDMLGKLDFSNIPNYAFIADTFKNLPFDPANEYSVPYMWGTVGILYNTSIITEPIEGYEALWDPKYAKQVFMLDSMRDTIGITLKMLGYSQNSTDAAQLEEAKNKLIEQKPNVLAYVGDDVKDKMIAGEAGMAVVWSGDAVSCMELNDDLAFVLPENGSNYFVDSLVIPKTSQHKKEAELFINFICQTDIALRNTEYIGYSSPHTQAVEQLPEEVRQSSAAYPSDEAIAKCEVFRDLGDATKLYDRIWTEIKAGL